MGDGEFDSVLQAFNESEVICVGFNDNVVVGWGCVLTDDNCSE